MRIDTLAPIVDTQPAYTALVELKDQRELYDKATKRFIMSKLRQTIGDLRATAKFIENELNAFEDHLVKTGPEST
jgi:hypothetical protein